MAKAKKSASKQAVKKVLKDKKVEAKELYKQKLMQRLNTFGNMKQLEERYKQLHAILNELDAGLRTIKEMNPEIDHEAIVEEIKAELPKEAPKKEVKK